MSGKGEAAELTLEENGLLAKLAKEGITSIEARCGEKGVEYPGLEAFTASFEGDISPLLDSLRGKGYLRVTRYDYHLTCPSGEHDDVKTSYTCPYCQSRQVKKTTLVEHTLCGYIGDASEFKRSKGYVCPKCGKDLGRIEINDAANARKVGLRLIGSNYLCDTCGGNFEKPGFTHTCNVCGKDFTYKEANYLRLPVYEVIQRTAAWGPEAENVSETTETAEAPTTKPINVPQELVMKMVEGVLTARGFSFSRDAKVPGKSGAEQTFSAVATKDNRRIIIDASTSGNQADAIKLIGKKNDVDAESIILIDTTESPFIATLGRKQNLTILSGKIGEDRVVERLVDSGEKKHDKRPNIRWPGRKK